MAIFITSKTQTGLAIITSWSGVWKKIQSHYPRSIVVCLEFISVWYKAHNLTFSQVTPHFPTLHQLHQCDLKLTLLEISAVFFFRSPRTLLHEKSVISCLQRIQNGYKKNSNYFLWMCNWGTSSSCQLPCDLPHPAVITSFQLETELLPTATSVHFSSANKIFLNIWSLFIRILLSVKIVLPQTQEKMKFAMALLSHSSSENNMNSLRGLRGNKKSCSPFGQTLAEDMFNYLTGQFRYCG